jgi:hypothetical protein
MIGGDNCEAVSGMNEWQGKPKYLDKTCPIASLSTTDSTLIDPGSNPGRRGRKLATNCLSYGTVHVITGFAVKIYM